MDSFFAVFDCVCVGEVVEGIAEIGEGFAIEEEEVEFIGEVKGGVRGAVADKERTLNIGAVPGVLWITVAEGIEMDVWGGKENLGEVREVAGEDAVGEGGGGEGWWWCHCA